MNFTFKRSLTVAFVAIAAMVFNYSCTKDELENTPPVISFETAQIAVNTDDNSSYDVKLQLSAAAYKDITVKLSVSGTAVENEHYTIPSKEITLKKGDTEGIIPITILNQNIWDSELTIIILLAPGTDYSINPQLTNQITVKLTKEIVLPQIGFGSTASVFTNPYNAETIKLQLVSNEALAYDAVLSIEVTGDMAFGTDFLLNNTSESSFTFPQGATSHEIELTFLKKDEAGFNKEISLTLVPADPKKVAISETAGALTLEAADPTVDFASILVTSALQGGEGYQVYQQIRTVESLWDGKIAINVAANPSKGNYLKSFRNMSFISAFDCLANTSGGDVLRLADMLRFVSDTVIADYGAARTTRFFSPSDSLLRFVANGKDATKGTVTAPRQKFTANLILKDNWELGANTQKPWHIDSKATNGVLANSTVATFHTVEVWLEKLEGTYDFTLAEPEILFEAWYKSDSPYFMKNFPEGLDVVKDGDFYKVTYRLYPRL